MGVSPYFKITPSLATKEVSDVYVKKNFDKLIEYFSNQNQLLDFKFFELVFTAATANYKLAHGFSYIPQDIITTKITGTGTIVYNYGLFDTTYMNITATGPCRVRFFAGTYWNYTTTVNDAPTVYTAQAALPSAAVTTSAANGNVINPMTTLGDIIYGAILGVPARLGIGASGTFLSSNGSVPAWAAISVAQVTIAAQAISAFAIDWSAGSVFTKTLSANSTFTFSNQVSGQTIVVRLTNTASNYTVTWPTVKWTAATAPTQTIGAKSDVYTFVYDGTSIYGSVVQNFS